MSCKVLKTPRLLNGGAAVEVVLDEKPCRFHAIWLRDNALDAATRSPGNGQRLISVLDLPPDTRIAEATWVEGHLRLTFAPDGKVADYGLSWLAANAYDRPAPREVGWTDSSVTRWDASSGVGVLSLAYPAVRDDAAVRRQWLSGLRRYGVARLTNTPRADSAACDVAGLFGYVRETNYGRWFDVRAEADPVNLAYTNLGLQAHTDNPYRDPVPTLQILVCRENAVEGGETVVVDGLQVAQRLQDEHHGAFELLAGYCARFAYAGAPGVRQSAKRPVFEMGPDGELIAVRFNNRSAAPLTDIPFDAMADYYAAYRAMARLVEDPAMGVSFRLSPGDAFVVDNTRVLHGRTAFTGAGGRWLQGCYADKDGLLSALAVLEAAGA